MILLEHNGKALFRLHNVPTPVGAVVKDRDALLRAVTRLPPRLVLKAQIAAGRRSRAGGIAFAGSAAEAGDVLATLLGRTIDGHPVESVLVEERVEFERERYAGIVVEGGELRLLFARNGGVDIEDITSADPANVVSIPVDPVEGPSDDQLRDGFARLRYAPEYWIAYREVGRALFTMAHTYDAVMIEINPLVELPAGRLLALDARVAIDDAALGRQPEIIAMQPRPRPTSPAGSATAGLEFRENPQGGSIGLIGLGGGLNVTLMDWIASAGSKVAVLVDIDESIGAGRAEQGFRAALSAFDRHPSVKAVLVNIVTCGYRLDEIAAELLAALDRGAAKPVILHLRGNGMAKAQQLLDAAGWANSASMAAAIASVVAAARA